MIDAYNVARRGTARKPAAPRATAPLALAGLISLTIVIHGLPAMVGLVPYYNFAISSDRPRAASSRRPASRT